MSNMHTLIFYSKYISKNVQNAVVWKTNLNYVLKFISDFKQKEFPFKLKL